jgi:hypothetical protein
MPPPRELGGDRSQQLLGPGIVDGASQIQSQGWKNNMMDFIQKEGPTLWLRWFCTWHRPIRKSTNGSTLTERKNILVLLAILALQIASLYRTACWGRWFLIFLRDTKSSHPLHLDGLMPCTKKPSAKGPAAREGSCHLTCSKASPRPPRPPSLQVTHHWHLPGPAKALYTFMGFVRCFLGLPKKLCSFQWHQNDILSKGWESGRLKLETLFGFTHVPTLIELFVPWYQISWLPGDRIFCSPSFKSLWISWSSADMKTFTKPKSSKLWRVMTIKSVQYMGIMYIYECNDCTCTIMCKPHSYPFMIFQDPDGLPHQHYHREAARTMSVRMNSEYLMSWTSWLMFVT